MYSKAKEALSDYFGHDSFRPLQKESIEATLNNKDSLVLMPTGGGKSICFQIPAIIQDGLCIVVSPLISLMRDQVDKLTDRKIPAAYLNSTLSDKEQQEVKKQMTAGNLDLVYISPERISRQYFQNFLQNSVNVNLFAIDEAHCISAWGHDFRPEYTNLKTLKKTFPQVPIIALTATADKTTRRDIIRQLNLSFEDSNIFHSSFDRPNLHFSVKSAEKRISKIKSFIRQRKNESGIVYCLSRKSTEKVANQLSNKNLTVKAYHAGMENRLRDQRQKKFVYDEIDIICATVAFGMGIDKSNIRWVIHYNLPKNIESYYQQIGRAGRDGAESRAVLFYNPGDFGKLRNFAQDSGQTDLQMAKLKHMKNFAEAKVCRRKILLNYFGEDYDEQCNNCDNCEQNISNSEDSESAYKILSALARVNTTLNINTLIDILRGNNTMKVRTEKYNEIKTFAEGGNLAAKKWEYYINQLVNLGFLRYSYDNYKKITLTKKGKKALNDLRTIHFLDEPKVSKTQKVDFNAKDQKTEENKQKDDLYSRLRNLRKKLSRKQEVPPYVIFNDKTLEEIIDIKPIAEHTLIKISGIGETKIERYGEEILKKIRQFLLEKQREDTSLKKLIFSLYKQNNTVSKIKDKLDVDQDQVYLTMEKLLQKGYNIDVREFISNRKLEEVNQILSKISPPYQAKQVRQESDVEISQEKLKLVIAQFEIEHHSPNLVYV
jgi:ATP-dependent DNA helicase RecQ